jgi:hypothetical protein
MIRNVLESINGIQIYPIISLILFLPVFGGMMLWALRLRRTYINEMGNLPLEDDHSHASKEIIQ